MTKPTDQLE